MMKNTAQSTLLKQPCITLKTTRAIGEHITLTVVCDGDLELTGVAEYTAEGVSRHEPRTYILTQPEVTIYGNVSEFSCFQNDVIDLDVCRAPELRMLSCGQNHLSSLRLEANLELEALYCGDNALTTLDVSANSKLKLLYCNNNALSLLQLPRESQLEWLSCGSNRLRDLATESHPRLASLYCDRNPSLEVLEVSANAALAELNCFACGLSHLDVSTNTELKTLVCGKNNLTALDTTHNTKLVTLVCHANRLTGLDLMANIRLRRLTCYRNPFSTEAINQIYCALPYRSEGDTGLLTIAYSYTDEHIAQVRASDADIARDKHWRVVYRRGEVSILTSGCFACSGGYGFSILGEEIDDHNYKIISSIPGITGHISYDPQTKTLTMEDATITGRGNLEEAAPITNWSNPELNIVLKGHNVIIDTPDSACLNLLCDTQISGDGHLEIGVTAGRGILLREYVTLTLDGGATIEIVGGEIGISGWALTREEILVIREATLRIAHCDEGVVAHLGELILGDCVLATPDHARFDAELHTIVDQRRRVVRDHLCIGREL